MAEAMVLAEYIPPHEPSPGMVEWSASRFPSAQRHQSATPLLGNDTLQVVGMHRYLGIEISLREFSGKRHRKVLQFATRTPIQ